MNYEQLCDDAITFIIDKDHCVAEEEGMVCEDIHLSGLCKCHDCFKNYLEYGKWWEKEYEPDPDRKWKEMHGE